MASRPLPNRPDEGPGRQCRVLIVDDSLVARSFLRRILTDAGGYTVVGDVSCADRALSFLSVDACDIILLDIEMPGMNGLDAIPLLREASDAAILVLSAHCRDGAEISVRAMTHGASDTLLKPAEGFAGRFGEALICTLDSIVDAQCEPRGDNRSIAPVPLAVAFDPPRPVARPVRCLAIASSTGGVHAMLRLLEALPARIEMPILITQHLPPDFIEPFARQVQLATGRSFQRARDGQRMINGQGYIAPGDAHLAVGGDGGIFRILLRRHPTSSGCMPSADPMFESIARTYGRDAVGVVLSGMGRDGAEGAAELVQQGGELLVQDQQSAVVWGMPGAVAERGIANLVADPMALGAHIARRAESFGWQ